MESLPHDPTIQADERLPIRALKLALEYHDGQVDKAGIPVALHIIRVGLRAMLHAASIEEMYLLLAIGLLHDILEDTDISQEEFQEAIAHPLVYDSVVRLTRLKEQTYFEYIEEVSVDKYASMVKMADIEDHLEDRGTGFVLPDSLRHRYETAKKQLLRHNESLKELYGQEL